MSYPWTVSARGTGPIFSWSSWSFISEADARAFFKGLKKRNRWWNFRREFRNIKLTFERQA